MMIFGKTSAALAALTVSLAAAAPVAAQDGKSPSMIDILDGQHAQLTKLKSELSVLQRVGIGNTEWETATYRRLFEEGADLTEKLDAFQLGKFVRDYGRVGHADSPDTTVWADTAWLATYGSKAASDATLGGKTRKPTEPGLKLATQRGTKKYSGGGGFFTRDEPIFGSRIGTVIPGGSGAPGTELPLLDVMIDNVQGGRIAIQRFDNFAPGDRAYASGYYGKTSQSASVTLPSGGPDGLGLTYFDQVNFSGGGSSTGLFLGTAFGIDAALTVKTEVKGLSAGYMAPIARPFPGSTISLGGEVGYDWVENEAYGQATVTSGGAPFGGIGQTQDFAGVEENLRARFMANWQVVLHDQGGVKVAASFQPSIDIVHGNIDARFDQTTSCGVCAPEQQIVSFSERFREPDIRVGGGLRAALELLFDDSIGVGVGYEHSWTPGGIAVRAPTSPADQPGGFDRLTREGDIVAVWAFLTF